MAVLKSRFEVFVVWGRRKGREGREGREGRRRQGRGGMVLVPRGLRTVATQRCFSNSGSADAAAVFKRQGWGRGSSGEFVLQGWKRRRFGPILFPFVFVFLPSPIHVTGKITHLPTCVGRLLHSQSTTFSSFFFVFQIRGDTQCRGLGAVAIPGQVF